MYKKDSTMKNQNMKMTFPKGGLAPTRTPLLVGLGRSSKPWLVPNGGRPKRTRPKRSDQGLT